MMGGLLCIHNALVIMSLFQVSPYVAAGARAALSPDEHGNSARVKAELPLANLTG
jgi:hypothetical protein